MTLQGWRGSGKRHQRHPPGADTQAKSSRQCASQAEGTEHGEDGGRARLLVLAEPSGKETVDGLWACAVGQIVKRQIPHKPGAPYMAEEDRGKEHSGNNFKISIIK